MMNREEVYIQKRKILAWVQSLPFYLFRIFPVKKNKIVFTCIEGSTGFSCNPKYIALELLKERDKYELVWLVNDLKKRFPKRIRKARNTLWIRAFHLTTAGIWIDNSRKQLEVRKRKGQFYLQTWHAKLGFKPTALDRGSSFSKIAYLVSKHDSDMIDCLLSNSEWYDKTLPTGMLYTGRVLRSGSPRCDVLLKRRDELKNRIRKHFGLKDDDCILMYAPTFRGGSQGTDRGIETGDHMPDFQTLKKTLHERFGGQWIVFVRMHPQIATGHHVKKKTQSIASKAPSNSRSKEGLIDISHYDDMYVLLAGCDAFLTDYSSAAFDAAVMRIPVFLYADDYETYENERGKLLWDMKSLPFPFSTNNEALNFSVRTFCAVRYREELDRLFLEADVIEDGMASWRVVKEIEKHAFE